MTTTQRLLARRFQAWLDAGCPHPHDHSPPQTEPTQRQLTQRQLTQRQLTLDLDNRSAA